MKKPWQFEGASCWGIDTEMFFSDNDRPSDETKVAKTICSSCMWLTECRTYALHNEVHGIWGSTDQRERVRLRQQLKIRPEPIYLRGA